MKKIIIVILLLLMNCKSPQIYGKFSYSNPLLKKTQIVAESEIVIFRDSLPPGIEKKGDIILVNPAYKSKLELLGKIEAVIQPGFSFMPGTIIMPYLIHEEDEKFLGKYCRNNVLILLPFPVFNIINPLGWPCFFRENYFGTSREAIEYQDNLREKIIRKHASENGANMVIMFKVDGPSVVNIHYSKSGNATGSIRSTTNWEIHAVRVIDKKYFEDNR